MIKENKFVKAIGKIEARRKGKPMDKTNENLSENFGKNNVVNMAEPIVTEIRKLLTKQEIRGFLTVEEKKKYLHYINMLSELYNERCKK